VSTRKSHPLLYPILTLSSALLLLGMLSGCDNGHKVRLTDDTGNGGGQPSGQLGDIIRQQGLTGDPSIGRNLPDINDPIAQLGMKLFYTKALGGDKDTACVSCHHPVLGGGDDLSLPIGVGAFEQDMLGPGRIHSPFAPFYDGGPTVPRNAPTTFNAGLWDAVMFMDGRVESLGKTPGKNGDDGAGITTPDVPYGTVDPDAGRNLAAAQSRFPITSPEEMRGHTFAAGLNNQTLRNYLQARIGNYGTGAGELPQNNWEAEFRSAFNLPDEPVTSLITSERIAQAIGEYERSQLFINTPWKAFVQGDSSAISAAAKRGALLFFNPVSKGGANCVACHSGDAFTDEQFHVIASPQVGRGKGDGTDGTNDYGRFRVTGNPDDKFAFRTPSLLNITATGPWSHAGAYTTLQAMILHHLNPHVAIQNYNFKQIDPSINADNMVPNTNEALEQLQRLRDAGRSKLVVTSLDDNQLADLQAFLEALTDPCVESRECLSPWIPDASVKDPDGLRLDGYNAVGQKL